jgi:hypothetical protein
MDMGGMDMTGFRMIPAGIGIMAPAVAPWHRDEERRSPGFWIARGRRPWSAANHAPNEIEPR